MGYSTWSSNQGSALETCTGMFSVRWCWPDCAGAGSWRFREGNNSLHPYCRFRVCICSGRLCRSLVIYFGHWTTSLINGVLVRRIGADTIAHSPVQTLPYLAGYTKYTFCYTGDRLSQRIVSSAIAFHQRCDVLLRHIKWDNSVWGPILVLDPMVKFRISSWGTWMHGTTILCQIFMVACSLVSRSRLPVAYDLRR